MIFALLAIALLQAPPSEPKSEARAFTHDEGIVDLLVIGPAAKTLYERRPGKPRENACGGEGLHKGDGAMTCMRIAEEYSCHIWLDPKKAALAQPEIDDC